MDENSTILYNSTQAMAVALNETKRTSFAEGISWDDATWILTSSFIIFTMQSGFGLLESGMVDVKNEVNIMVKNAVDVIFGGISFWMFGFGLAFGEDRHPAEMFLGLGYFCLDSTDHTMGFLYTWFIFQLSFATTATTIVSGAMAERAKLKSYIVFSFVNTLVYCLPAHWIWSPQGFLYRLGAVDIAGAGAVHLVGGVTGLVATLIMKPRLGRFDGKRRALHEITQMGSPTNSLLGMFMLWWGWLGFNCGSTFGISGGKWKLAARSAVATVNSSMGGGAVGVIYRPWEAVVIGSVGGLLANVTPVVMEILHVDDPVGVIPVHLVCGVWSMLSVGLFTAEDTIQGLTYGRAGLFRGGGPYLLGVQLLAIVCFTVWTVLVSIALLKVIDVTMGLRVSPADEETGADACEHGIINPVQPMLSTRKTSVIQYGGHFAYNNHALTIHEDSSHGHDNVIVPVVTSPVPEFPTAEGTLQSEAFPTTAGGMTMDTTARLSISQ